MTSALPYVNNELHLGQFIGSILPADVYSRFLKLKGEECIYVCGTDEYGTPVAVAAQKEGLTPKVVADKYYALQKKAVDGFRISTDIFSRTTTPEHTKVTQDFYLRLKENGYIFKKEVEQLYCGKCDRFLPDRYVEGKCPECGAAGARGDQCDACGNPLEPLQLIEPYCVTCKGTPVLRKSEHVFFDLPKVQEQISDWLEKHNGLFPNAKNFATSFVKEGLREKDISRNIEWGIPIPGEKGLVFYVWFDAPIGYITFTEQLGKGGWWKDKDTKLVHFLGKDNIVFHAVYFPGMLIAHRDFVLADKIGSYEYLTFGGAKLSKSKGNRPIWALEALALYPADYWRFILISLLPEHRDTEFTWGTFQEKINNDLNDVLGNFIHRTLTLAKKLSDGKVPAPDKLTAQDEKVLDEIVKKHKEAAQFFESIKLKDALGTAIDLARTGNQYLTAEEPWKNKDKQTNVIYVCLNIVSALSVLLEPFIPESAHKIRKFLDLGEKYKWSDGVKRLEPGKSINDFGPLFKKIEDKEVTELKKRFG